MSKTRKIPGALRRRFLGALAAMPVVMLAACGGGGGGGGDITPPPATVSAVVITSANAKPVSADALANSTDTVAATSSAALVTGAQVHTGSGGSPSFRLASAARTLAAKVPALPALAVGAQTTQTVQCSLGGSMTVSANIANSNALTAGDTMSISASNCSESVEGSAETMSGQLSISIVEGSFSSMATVYPMHLKMRVVSTALSLRQGSTTTTVEGDLTLDINQSSSNVGTYSVSGTSLGSTISTSAGSRSFTMKNYSQTYIDNAGAGSYSVTATIETTNSRLGSGTFSYTVSTPSNLITDSSGAYTGGSLKVTGGAAGGGNSALLLTVTGTNQFQIQVDANGDGAYESTTTTTRTELESLV